jgi:hypothetical protein
MSAILKISFMKYFKSELNVGKLAILHHRIFLLSFRYLKLKDYSIEHYNIICFVLGVREGTKGKTDI